jgi:hypothetical protein
MKAKATTGYPFPHRRFGNVRASSQGSICQKDTRLSEICEQIAGVLNETLTAALEQGCGLVKIVYPSAPVGQRVGQAPTRFRATWVRSRSDIAGRSRGIVAPCAGDSEFPRHAVPSFLGPCCCRLTWTTQTATDASVKPGNICGIACNNRGQPRQGFQVRADAEITSLRFVAICCALRPATVTGWRQYYCTTSPAAAAIRGR